MGFLIILPLCYLIGSVPFGIVLGKLLKGIDLREYGSGNIGAANAFRALGFFGGLLVLLGDVAKGLLATHIAGRLMVPELSAPAQVCGGLAAISGHNYSCFLGFKGGKGIATSLGVILYLNWWIALLCLAIWILVVAITRYSSLGSLTGSLCLPVFMTIFHQPAAYILFAGLACCFAFYTHRGNIRRLLSGTELKISEKHPTPSSSGDPEDKGEEG